MKNLEIFVMLSLAFCVNFYGCEPVVRMDKYQPKEYYFDTNQYKIVEIDSCEYVASQVYAGYSICHKGNCRFCLNRFNP